MTLDKNNNPEVQSEIHLLDYVIILAKYSRMIIYTSVIFTLLTLGYLLMQPNQYTAIATILPPQQNVTLSAQILDTLGVSGSSSSSGGMGGVAALLGLKSPGDLYVGMLKGSTIFNRMIDRFNLKESYDKPILDDARNELSERTDIRTGKDGLVLIAVTDEDPKKAATMANAFVEELDKLQQEIAIRDAGNQLAFLEKERELANANLTRAEEALRVFSEKSSVIQIDAQAKGMIEYIAQMRAAIDAKEVQIRVLQKHATPANYDLIRLETELKGLKDKLRAAEIQAADQACVGDVCISTGRMPSLGLEYFRLYREVKYQETLLQLFSKMVEIARIDSARNAMVSTIQPVDEAFPPQRKSKPKRALASLLVGSVTFFIMVLLAFGREYWKHLSQAEGMRLDELSKHTQPWRNKLNQILMVCRLKKK